MPRISCGTNYTFNAPAPNPDPSRWELIKEWQGKGGYVLLVRYLDATNFEGLKVMVYRGKRPKRLILLDPHFADDKTSPIARFRPDAEGIALARLLAEALPPQ